MSKAELQATPAMRRLALLHRSLERCFASPRNSAAAALLVAAIVAVWLSYYWAHVPASYHSDAAQLWAGARALVNGRDPYSVVGVGREFNWPFPLLYPLPAVMLFVPLALLSEHAAAIVWATIGAAAFTFALLQRKAGPLAALIALLSAPLHEALQVAQWSPLVSGAAAIPALAALIVAKPNLTAAVVAGQRPNQLRNACLVAATLLLVSFVAEPTWPAHWLRGLPTATHIKPPLFRPAGFLVLLCALKWRRADARLVLVFSVLSQSPFLHETVPLLLIPANALEQLILAVTSWGGVLWWNAQNLHLLGYAHWADLAGDASLFCCILPCVVMILGRPNQWEPLGVHPGIAMNKQAPATSASA